MQLEEGGLGTLRLDALSGSGPPDAWILVHTQLTTRTEVEALVHALHKGYMALWNFRPTTRWQVHADCVSESCTTLVSNNLNRVEDDIFCVELLKVYRCILEECGPKGIQPPIAHIVNFVQSGKCVHYEGRN